MLEEQERAYNFYLKEINLTFRPWEPAAQKEDRTVMQDAEDCINLKSG